MKMKSHDRAKGQTQMTISLPQELKARIESAAERSRRSKSNWIALTIEEILSKHEKQAK